jgi:hypothetical protein
MPSNCKSLLAQSASLEFLAIQLYLLSPVGVLALAEGISASRLNSIEMKGAPTDDSVQIMDMLYLQGIQPSQIKSISLIGILGSIDTLVSVLPPMSSLSIAEVGTMMSMSEIHILSTSFAQTPCERTC